MPRTLAPPLRSAAHPRRPDAHRDARSVRAAYESFLDSGVLPRGVHPLVADSWRRSLHNGVDPDTPHAETTLSHDDLVSYRGAHPLAAVHYYRKESFSKFAAPALIEEIRRDNDIVVTAIGD